MGAQHEGAVCMTGEAGRSGRAETGKERRGGDRWVVRKEEAEMGRCAAAGRSDSAPTPAAVANASTPAAVQEAAAVEPEAAAAAAVAVSQSSTPAALEPSAKGEG